MSGHSKWANIKHRKGAQDAKRAKVFTRLIRELTIAAREGGGDIEANPRLRSAVTTARGSNMPNDTIEKAIKRGTGEGGGIIIDGQQEPHHGRGQTRLHQVRRQPGRQRLCQLHLRPQGRDPARRRALRP